MMTAIAALRTGDGQAIDRVIGRAMRLERLRQGLSRADLADQLGISAQEVRCLEYGAARIGAVMLSTIANRLDMPVMSFLAPPAEPGGDIVPWTQLGATATPIA